VLFLTNVTLFLTNVTLFLTNVTLFLTNVTLSLKTTLSSSVFVSGTPRDPLFLSQDHRVILCFCFRITA
jgi:hypothetical protein